MKLRKNMKIYIWIWWCRGSFVTSNISVCFLVVKTHLFASVFLLGADMMLAEVMGDENVKLAQTMDN